MVTGARRAELCALRWRHLDVARNVLVIRASTAHCALALLAHEHLIVVARGRRAITNSSPSTA
jgi:integrase